MKKARADYTSAKTAFETATNELHDTQLIAPFDGYVGEVYIEKYQDVKATQPVISFIDITQLKIEAYVTQDIALQAGEIKEVSVRFDIGSDVVYPAKVVEISKSTTRNNLSFLMTALLPNKQGEWPAGVSGKVLLDLPSSSTTSMITIPQTALNHRPTEGDYVWTVDNAAGKVSKRKIVLGELLPNGKVEVKGGLQAGETVAVSKLRFLSEGTSVEIMAQKNKECRSLLKSKFGSMKFVKYFLQKRSVTILLLLLVLGGGLLSYVKMGKLEDAPFTIKQALVLTPYPGASPSEVQSQVTDVLEESIQSLGRIILSEN